MTADEMIAVLEAWNDGKTIQFRPSSVAAWVDCNLQPVWNFDLTQYRVKPEPREFWICGDTNVYKYSTGPHCCKCIHVREVIE